MGDFRPGWSDLDILVLTRETITPEQAGRLLFLRQEMLEKEPENPDYRSFEGGMLDLCAFLDGHPSRVIYWGTGGQRVTDTYLFDSFCMTELLESGLLLFGPELRGQLRKPSYAELRADVAAHCRTICQYGVRPQLSRLRLAVGHRQRALHPENRAGGFQNGGGGVGPGKRPLPGQGRPGNRFAGPAGPSALSKRPLDFGLCGNAWPENPAFC